MGNIKTEDEDDFIVSSSELEQDEADAVFEAQQKKKKRSRIISRIILVISACVFIFAAYNLISILLEYKKGNDIYNGIENDVLDDTPVNITIGDDDQDVTIPFTYNHQALLDINPDGLGFLYIPSTDTRLPIAQTTDNDFYLTHTFDRTYNKNGCLFVDYRITDKLNANHVIIYGHNMNSGAMFGSLSKYKSSGFYNTSGNDVFYIYTEDVIREYRIFTTYISDPISDTYTFNFVSLDGLRSYANRMKAQSMYDTGVNVDDTTQVVTFSTCTYDGKQRFIISGTYVGESKINDGTSDETSASE